LKQNKNNKEMPYYLYIHNIYLYHIYKAKLNQYRLAIRAYSNRNNTIFEDQHWRIQDVVRKTFLLHDECISYHPNLGLDPHLSS